MTTELTLLAWTIVLAVVYIIAFDVVRTGQYGTKWNMGPRDAAMPPLSPVAERLGRAQANLFETLPLFIGAVLIAHAAGIHTSRTVLGAELYFWGRVIYLPLYAFGVPVVRSLVWLVSVAGLALILIAVL
ncbi:MAPEG family protein [Polymorphobacter sp. PAMC 29334]|uniref:MAPEG family protein n=1 Tax=Polymorphobacter sp. PAMC 29334 TaxID=2862331 RepID=UPI001C75F019|nr:MAPEG family protein [Polymorphobacter sp. PAMC 29334]QYE33673.1 MAPEG family protein [Polymorphobacter sp. PAMC 29334]